MLPGPLAPIYCDNRRSLGFPRQRRDIARGLMEMVEKKALSFDIIAGVATAGIPYASILAHEMNRPLIYVRAKPKGHGQKNIIEGAFEAGQRVLLVEDLVNQGTSIEKAILALRDAALQINTCMTLVDYRTRQAQKRLKNLDVALFALTDIFFIIDEATSLSEDQKKVIRDWHGRMADQEK